MIVPMKKIRLVVLESERIESVAKLRNLGLLHVETVVSSSDSLVSLQESLSRLRQATSILSENKGKKKVKKAALPADAGKEEGLALADKILALNASKSASMENATRLQVELDRIASWGDLNPADFAYLAEHGVHLFAFEMPTDDFAALPDDITTVTLKRDKKNVRFVIASSATLLPESLPDSARQLALPEKSSAEMRAEIEAERKAIEKANADIAALFPQKALLDAAEKILLKEIEFETVRASMQEISLVEEGEKSAPVAVKFPKPSLAWLSGYAPAEKVSLIMEAARQNSWACISDDPAEEDNVPTQLKNNRVVNLIAPLLDFLGTVPGYREIDISGWFLLFFGIFFAMIFGDGGYGALLTIISIAGIVKTAKKGTPPALYMMLYLSIMTMLWGVVTCTWFSLPAESLPQTLRLIAIPAFSSENPESSVNIQVFCFVLGLLQMSIAHIVCIIQNIKSPKFLGDLGSLLMLVGMFFVILSLVVDAEKYPITREIVAMIVAGFVLNFVFANYDGKLGAAVKESFQNIISMILGVANVFGDIMSYIRLWAVALAGGAIASTVNQMTGPMLGGFLVFIGVLILFFGHGLNMIMNVLSVVVHGVRLNILEFSNHIGLTWSGFKYKPFSDAASE